MSRKSRVDFRNIHYVCSVVERLPSRDCGGVPCQPLGSSPICNSSLRQQAQDFLVIRQMVRSPVYEPKASSFPEYTSRESPYSYLHNPELCSRRQAAELKGWLLGQAALEGASDVCQYLLDRGANPSHRTGGMAAIHMAAIGGCANVLEILKRKESLELRDDNGHAPLHHAVISGSAECVFWLLTSGVQLDDEVRREILSKRGKNSEEVFEAYSAYQKGDPYHNETVLSLEETSNDYDSKVSALAKSLAESYSENKQIRRQWSVDHSQLAVLKMELKECKKKEATLKKKLEERETAQSVREVDWNNQERELKLKLSEKEDECESLRKKLADLTTELSQLKGEGKNRARISILTENENEMKMKLWFNFMEVEWLRTEFSASGCVLQPGSLEAEQQDLFLSLAKKLGHDWKFLGASLNIADAQIENIEYQNPFSEKICGYKMLKTWCLSQGKALSTNVLIRALKNSGRSDLAELVEEQMGRSP